MTTRQAAWLLMVGLAALFFLLSLLLSQHGTAVPHHPPPSIWMVQ